MHDQTSPIPSASDLRHDHRTLWFLMPLFMALSTSADADHPTVAFGSEASGPINTIAATALPVGNWAMGLRNELIDRDAFTDRRLASLAGQGVEDVHSVDSINSTSASLAYGLSERITVSVRLPWVIRDNIREGELEAGEGEAHAHGDAAGLGDLVFLGNYRAVHWDGFDAALQIGFKAPSGTTEEDDAGARLETEFQPSTGSWDFLVGGAMSKAFGRWGLHTNVLFNLTTEGSQDTELGDAVFYNLAAVVALTGSDAVDHHHGATLAAHPHLRIDAMLEINGETRWKNEIAGVSEANSGGTIVYLSPGVRASYGKVGGFISVGYPIVDDPKGVQTDVDFRLVGGVSLWCVFNVLMQSARPQPRVAVIIEFDP